MNHKIGNVLDAREEVGATVIGHVVNDCGAFGAGVAAQIAERWPVARAEYCEWYKTRARFYLGGTRTVQVEPRVYVVHLLAQRGLPSRLNPTPLDLPALARALDGMARFSSMVGGAHLPRIGAGLARGDWSQIEPMIERAFAARNGRVTIWTLSETS